MELKLPNGLVSKGDAARLRRQLGMLNDALVGANYRHQDTGAQIQQATPLLAELAVLNSLDLKNQEHRDKLAVQLDDLSNRAPSLHISFTAEPAPAALERILVWMRGSLHPQILLQVGLQPNIAAGCVLRTPNHILDMSLRETLKKQQPLLLKLLKGARGE